MKAIIISILFVLTCAGSFAQNSTELKKGSIFTDSKWAYVNSVFGNDETGYYTFSDMKFRERIEKYDKQFNKLVSVKLKFNNEKFNGREEESTFFQNGKIFVVSTSQDKKSGIRTFFIETLNTTSLLSNNDVVKICEFTKSEWTYYSVVLSDDKSKILIIRALDPDATGNKQYGTFVYDCRNSKSLFTENIVFPFSSSKINFKSAFVGNNGSFSLYYHLYENGYGQSKDTTSYTGHLLCLFNAGKVKCDAILPMSNMKPGILKLSEKNDGELFVAGFYTSDTIGKIDGCFSTVINNSGKCGDVKTASLISIGRGTNIDHLLYMKDGSYILIGEESNHFGVHTAARDWTMSGPSTYNSPVNSLSGNREPGASTIHDAATSRNYFYHGNIVLVKFNQAGEPIWNKLVKKNQQFIVPGEYGYAYFMYASYSVITSDDKVHLIFNDHINNAFKKDEAMEDGFQRKAESALIDVSVSTSNGNYSKVILQKSKENKVLFRPSSSKQISENELIMFGSSDDDHQGMIVKF